MDTRKETKSLDKDELLTTGENTMEAYYLIDVKFFQKMREFFGSEKVDEFLANKVLKEMVELEKIPSANFGIIYKPVHPRQNDLDKVLFDFLHKKDTS